MNICVCKGRQRAERVAAVSAAFRFIRKRKTLFKGPLMSRVCVERGKNCGLTVNKWHFNAYSLRYVPPRNSKWTFNVSSGLKEKSSSGKLGGWGPSLSAPVCFWTRRAKSTKINFLGDGDLMTLMEGVMEPFRRRARPSVLWSSGCETLIICKSLWKIGNGAQQENKTTSCYNFSFFLL